jgi:hypothetical protein
MTTITIPTHDRGCEIVENKWYIKFIEKRYQNPILPIHGIMLYRVADVPSEPSAAAPRPSSSPGSV